LFDNLAVLTDQLEWIAGKVEHPHRVKLLEVLESLLDVTYLIEGQIETEKLRETLRDARQGISCQAIV